MKKYVFLLIVNLCAAVASLSAQSPLMRDVFAAMPDSVLPMVTKNNRLDCIDFIENQMEAKARNLLDEYVVLEALTPDYARFRTSAVSLMELKLLPVTDSTHVLCVVTTAQVGDTVSALRLNDSNIRFLRSDWSVLSADSAITFSMPALERFVAGAAPDSLKFDYDQALSSLRTLHPVQMSLSPDAPALTLTLQTALLSKEERRAVADRLSPLVLHWVGKGFE